MKYLFLLIILVSLGACKDEAAEPQPQQPKQSTLIAQVLCSSCSIAYQSTVLSVTNTWSKSQTIESKGEWVIEINDSKVYVEARFVLDGVLVADMVLRNGGTGKLSYLR